VHDLQAADSKRLHLSARLCCLDTLFLRLPVSWHGTIAQYAGRLHRLYDGKREVRVYDYADLNVPMLVRMFDRRCRGYEAIGYTIELPGSAEPGWPAGAAEAWITSDGPIGLC